MSRHAFVFRYVFWWCVVAGCVSICIPLQLEVLLLGSSNNLRCREVFLLVFCIDFECFEVFLRGFCNDLKCFDVCRCVFEVF